MSQLYRPRQLLPSAVPLFFLFFSIVAAAKCHYQPTEPQNPPPPITRFRQYLSISTAHPKPDYTSAVNFLTNFSRTIPNLQSETFYFTPQKDKPLLLLTWPGSEPTFPSILLNSHLDSVPVEPAYWDHPPFSAHYSQDGKIFARGAQDDKCIGLQYLEAIKGLILDYDFNPLRNIHVSFVPDEETGGFDGMAKFVKSEEFERLNVGFVLDEGQASHGDEYRVFYADRSPWHIVIKAVGVPGHGSRMYDNGAMENLMKSIEVINKFRAAEFDKIKAGLAANSEVVSANNVYLKAGIPSPTGYVMNMQPSEAEAGFDVRMPPTADPDALRRRIAEEWAPAWRNMTFEALWNIHVKKDCLWVRWIHHMYLRWSDIWEVSMSKDHSALFKRILQIRDSIIQRESTSDGAVTVMGSWMIRGRTPSAAYQYFRPSSPVVPWAGVVWTSCIPPKYSFVLWLAMRGRLQTRDRLMYLEIDRSCQLCGHTMESTHHLFFTCPFSMAVWKEIRQWCGLSRQTTTLRAAIRRLRQARGRSYRAQMQRLAFSCTVYYIWLSRNRLIFEQTRPIVTDVCHRIQRQV